MADPDGTVGPANTVRLGIDRHWRLPGDLRDQNRTYRALRIGGAVVLALWVIGLAAFSTALYHRNFLGEDFATYNQAWTLIGQGHLNPYDTVFGFPFVKSDFELIIWPLAIVHLVLPYSAVLLWIQDAAVAGSGLIAYLWALEYLEHRKVNQWVVVGVAAAVLLATVANPGTYSTLSFDVHLEPISTFFALLAARQFWRGRPRWGWVWVGVVLLCGSFAALMVVGLGVSALLARPDTRRSGVLLVDHRTGLDCAHLCAPRQPGVGSLALRLPGRSFHTDRCWRNGVDCRWDHQPPGPRTPPIRLAAGSHLETYQARRDRRPRVRLGIRDPCCRPGD